jgi:hypothetical protein
MKRIIVLLLLLTACQFNTGQQMQPQDVYVGTAAISSSFASQSTSDIFMCKETDVFVDLVNEGVHDVNGGFYSLIADEFFLKLISQNAGQFSLEGKTQFNPKGGFEKLWFKMLNNGLPEQFETYTTDVIFRACYPYTTYANIPVCIDPDIHGINPQKACTPSIYSSSAGQGGPVAVTYVEPLMSPEGDKVRPMFRITINNLGYGTVVSVNGVDAACMGGSQRRELVSSVEVSVELQGERLDCNPDPVRLRQNEASFTCESSELYGLSSGTFSSFLSIDLDYGYVNTNILPITITRVAGQGSC